MSGPPVLVTRRLPLPAVQRLEAGCQVTLWPEDSIMPRERFLSEAAGKAGLLTLLTDQVDEELLVTAGEQLVAVSNYAVGVDNVDVAACTRRGVMVTNTPDVLTEATADMAWALLLAAARRVAEGDRLLRAGRPFTWGPEFMLSRDVSGKTLGIIGFGRIGRAVARRSVGFGMKVLFHHPAVAAGTLDDGAQSATLDDLLTRSDFVSLHVPLTPETRHMISAPQLRQMKPTAVLVNTARGPVLDEVALAEALEHGVIFAAGLDVYEHEPEIEPRLLSDEKVVLAPHLGSATVETRAAMGLLAADNLLAALRGERPQALVNPEVLDLPRPPVPPEPKEPQSADPPSRPERNYPA
jgi:glyoxylate reductase